MSMPTIALPAAPASGMPRTHTSASTRSADAADGRGFERALEQSRGARKPSGDAPGDAVDTTGTAATDESADGPLRKQARESERDRRNTPLTPAEVMAMLAPLPPPVVPAAATAGALASAGFASVAVQDGAAPDSLASAQTASLLASGTGAEAGTAADDAAAAATKAAATEAATVARDATGRMASPAADAVNALAASATEATQPATLADVALALAQARAVPGVATEGAPSTARGPARSRTSDGGSTPATGTTLRDTSSTAGSAGDRVAMDFDAALAAASSGNAAAEGQDASARQGNDAQGTTTLPFQANVTTGIGATDRASASAAAAPAMTVAPEVGEDAWAAALAQQMLRMSTSGQHVARLNLNPAELGPLQVTLSMNDQQTQAMFMSSHEAVRKALEAALPQLRSTLAAQGIELGQASVNSGASQQFGGQGSSFAGQESPRPRTPADYPGAIARTDAQPPQAGAASAQRARSPGGLDTFA